MSADEDEAPGWHAIDVALEPIYGSAEPPFHYAPQLPGIFGGPDPIDGISVYRTSSFDREHWHFVTYGFSELYAKENSDPETSGFGFELTFRLVRARGESQPPAWALNFLQNIGRYVFSSGNTFQSGHYMNLNGPIALGSSTLIHAIVFARDPELPETIDTLNGRVDFLQIVGITVDEVLAIKQWDAQRFLALLAEVSPGALTDLERQSLLHEPAPLARVRAGISTDGSSTRLLFPAVASYVETMVDSTKHVAVTLGANGVRDLLQVFPGRLPFRRDLTLVAGDTAIQFVPSSQAGWQVTTDSVLEIHVSPDFAAELPAMLRVQAGNYQFKSFPNLELVVERSAIKDRDGNIVEWVG